MFQNVKKIQYLRADFYQVQCWQDLRLPERKLWSSENTSCFSGQNECKFQVTTVGQPKFQKSKLTRDHKLIIFLKQDIKYMWRNGDLCQPLWQIICWLYNHMRINSNIDWNMLELNRILLPNSVHMNHLNS